MICADGAQEIYGEWESGIYDNAQVKIAVVNMEISALMKELGVNSYYGEKYADEHALEGLLI